MASENEMKFTVHFNYTEVKSWIDEILNKYGLETSEMAPSELIAALLQAEAFASIKAVPEEFRVL